jgi:AcrR family transcriptional regulator
MLATFPQQSRFPNPQDVTLAAIDRVHLHTIDELRRISLLDRSVTHRIGQMLLARILFRFDQMYPYRHSLPFVSRGLASALITRTQHHLEEEAEIFAPVLHEGNRACVLNAPDPPATALTLLDATNSLLPESLTLRQLEDRDGLKRKATRLIDLLLQGLIQHNLMASPA